MRLLTLAAGGSFDNAPIPTFAEGATHACRCRTQQEVGVEARRERCTSHAHCGAGCAERKTAHERTHLLGVGHRILPRARWEKHREAVCVFPPDQAPEEAAWLYVYQGKSSQSRAVCGVI